jgi:hypothetical protein
VNASVAGVGANAAGCPIIKEPTAARTRARSFTLGLSASDPPRGWRFSL